MKKTRYTLAQQNVIRQGLSRLEAQGKLKRQGQRTFVLCPFHPDKNPSALITTDNDGKFPMGFFKCFGCGATGDWNKLAEEYGLQKAEGEEGFGTVQKYDGKVFKKRVGKEKVSEPMTELNLKEPAPVKKSWRGIPLKLLKDVGAKMTVSEYGKPFLYLPCLVNEEEVGGIRCVLEGQKALVKYKNSPGEWSKETALYPYDYTGSLMDKFEDEYGKRCLIIVEGARDALTLCSKGLPTLGLLGTTSWSEKKKELMFDLDPDFVLVCMDGDRAGRKAEEMIYEDLKESLPCRKMNLSRFNKMYGFEMDPGAAPEEVIAKIKQVLLRSKAGS